MKKISDGKYGLTVQWNPDKPGDKENAEEFLESALKVGWTLLVQPGEKKNLKAQMNKGTSVQIADILLGALRVRELSSLMQILQGIGLEPCISTRGSVFRFHVSAASNYWADHKVPDEAAARAVESWNKAGRPPLK